MATSENTTGLDANSSDNASCTELDERIREAFLHTDLRFVLVLVFGGTVAVAGIIANGTLLVVLVQKKLRETNQIYSLVLACLDLGFQINYIFLMCVLFIGEYYTLMSFYYFWHSYSPLLNMLGQAWPIAQTYLIIAASTDRFLTALSTTSAYPDERSPSKLKSRSINISACFSAFRRCARRFMCSQHQRYATATIIVIGATALRASVFWEFRTEYTPDCNGTFAYVSLENTEFFANADYKWFKFWILPVVQIYFPFTALLVVNVLIVVEFKRSVRSEKLQKMAALAALKRTATDHAVETVVTSTVDGPTITPLLSKKYRFKKKRLKLVLNSEEAEIEAAARARRKDLRGATAAMVAIVSCYLIANTLNVFISFVEQFKGHDYLYKEYPTSYTLANDVSSILVILTCAIRLPIYYVCNRAIRKAIQRLFSCGGSEKEVVTSRSLEILSTERTTLSAGGEETIKPANGTATVERRAGQEMFKKISKAPIALSELSLSYGTMC